MVGGVVAVAGWVVVVVVVEFEVTRWLNQRVLFNKGVTFRGHVHRPVIEEILDYLGKAVWLSSKCRKVCLRDPKALGSTLAGSKIFVT